MADDSCRIGPSDSPKPLPKEGKLEQLMSAPVAGKEPEQKPLEKSKSTKLEGASCCLDPADGESNPAAPKQDKLELLIPPEEKSKKTEKEVGHSSLGKKREKSNIPRSSCKKPTAVENTSTSAGQSTQKKSNKAPSSKKATFQEAKKEEEKPSKSKQNSINKETQEKKERDSSPNKDEKKKSPNEAIKKVMAEKERSNEANKQRALSTLTKKLSARNQAKQEENEYLKLRKQQLLMDFLPKSKGALLRRSDDKFPSHALKAMEKWNFGAMKAKYLSIRPNGKYATWFGKKHDEKHKNERCITLKERILTSRQPPTRGGSSAENEKVEKSQKSANKGTKSSKRGKNSAFPRLPDIAAQQGTATDLEAEEEMLMANVRYSRPFNDNGQLFWLEEADNVDTEDEESIVNIEAVVKDGETAQKFGTKFAAARKSVPFNPNNPVKELAKVDAIFTANNVYLNTIVNVINLTEDFCRKQPMPPVQPTKIKINQTMKASSYAAGISNIQKRVGMKWESRPLKTVVKSCPDRD